MRAFGIVVMAALVTSSLAGCLQGNEQAVEQAPILRKLGGLTGGLPVPVCDYKFDGSYSQVCATGPYLEIPFERTLLQSKIDGIDIEVGWWLPEVPAGTKVPIIVMASPYYGNLGEPMGRKSGYLNMLTNNFVQHGYAVAGISVRGTGDSGGCMDLMGNREIQDIDQALTWLGEQEWSSGSIGLIGLSYDGSTPWSAASTGNPFVKTIVPISGVPDVYGLMFKNGSAESRGPFLLNALYYAFAVRVWIPNPAQPEVPIMAAQRLGEGVVCPESWVGIGAAAYSGVTGARDPQGWWAERNRKPAVAANYKGSIFSIQGMQDWNVDPSQVIPWVDELNQTGIPTYQFLGQWGHSFPDTNTNSGSEAAGTRGKTQRWDWAEILLNWFDYWLKGQTTVALGPPVQIQDNQLNWRYEEHFPPRDANWTKYQLASGNRLTQADAGPEASVLLTPAGYAGEPPEQLRQGPGFLADFSTQPVEQETRISGLPRLHVTVTPSAVSGHLAAWLYTVDEDDEWTNIGQAMMNLYFADGTETMRPLTPGQRILAKMEFQPLDAVVPAGHRIVVRVWENADQDRLPSVPPAPVTLHFGGTVPSHLELPIVERPENVFFTPPFPQATD
jgi:predicted acyl esterase